MSDLEKYAEIIDGIFGKGTTTFNISGSSTNNVIGALNRNTDFFEFRSNFIARLQRLNKIYFTNAEYRKEILVQVNQIADSKNWQGAFAELAAYDHLNGDILNHKAFIQEPIQPNVTLSNNKSFALELGKHETNVDGFIEDVGLYFDVKCLKDNVSEILDGIYKQVKHHLGTNDAHFSAEHELHISYNDFQSKRNLLLNELKSEVNTTEKQTYLKSKIITGLNYRILWGSGISFAERSYHPYSHARNLHSTIFNYANKFIKDSPTVIVLVVFPWYNLVISSFDDSNKKFYRAIARRVFCQYLHDDTLFAAFDSSFTGTEKIFEVSRFISGIIFLEDDTILSKDPTVSNVKSYTYYNPNALNSIPRTQIRNYIASLRNSDFDDFEFDNY